MITDHPFLDNNGPTYHYGVCRACALPSSAHTHRQIQRRKGARIYTVPEECPREPTAEEVSRAKARKAKEFSDPLDFKIISETGGWRPLPPESIWTPETGFKNR